MSQAYSLPGAILMANIWWYAFSVLRPAQALKPLGLYRSRSLGTPPALASADAGQFFCLEYPEPVLLSERPAGYGLVEDFDKLASAYEKMVEPFSKPIFEEVVKLVGPLATSHSRILDCSCGPGTELLELSKFVPGGEVVGVDLAADMVLTACANARSRGVRNAAFFQADVAELPEVFEQRFDFVYCSLAFHHYPDPLGALEEMLRVLMPGGHALVVDAGPWWMKALGSPLASWGDPGWVAFRTGEEFEELFEQAGFSGFYWTEVLPGMGLSIGTR